MNENQEVIQLVPGLRGKPVFATREEYERFRLEFAEAVRPDLERYALARRKSEEASFYHFVR
jgi:hypothetical protein